MTNIPMEIDWVKYFKCKKCWEVKPLNKCYFHINTMYSTGFNSKCKSCVKEERESKPKVKYITRAELEEENKKLNIKVASLEWEIKWLNYTIDKLKEENQTLELWLDRKEKLNEKYRRELKSYVYDAKQVRDIC